MKGSSVAARVAPRMAILVAEKVAEKVPACSNDSNGNVGMELACFW